VSRQFLLGESKKLVHYGKLYGVSDVVELFGMAYGIGNMHVFKNILSRVVWAGFLRVRMRTSRELLWTQSLTFSLHKTEGIFFSAKRVSAYHEKLCCMDLICLSSGRCFAFETN